MNKENLQAELDGLKVLLKDINNKIAIDWFNNPESPTTEFKAIDEFYSEVYDLQGRTVIQNRIDTPQELTGVDLITEEDAKQLINDALDNRGVIEVAELLEKLDDKGKTYWYCYDNDTKHLFCAEQDYMDTMVLDNIQTAING